MEQPKVNWNDDRLDHFAAQVDKRFEQVDKRFEQVDKRFDRVEGRIDAQGAHFDARFNHLEARFEKRFDSLQQSMIITLASFLVAFAGLFASLHL
jgi:hypothetical protein